MTPDPRSYYDIAELAGFWAQCREALEAPQRRTAIRVDVGDFAVRHEVGRLLDRKLLSTKVSVALSTVDSVLRSERFGLGLAEVLELVHGRPVTPRSSQAAEQAQRRQAAEQVLRSALSDTELADQPWVERWIDWVCRYAKVDAAELPTLAERAVSVLGGMSLNPLDQPLAWVGRSELAGRLGGGAHELDRGKPLPGLVLRAAIIAHGMVEPRSAQDRRDLWERCGVTSDSVSATALCWALPVLSDSRWATSLRARTAEGLPTHLSHRDLRAAPAELVAPGTVIAVCENPRVLEAAVDARITHPVVCVSGHLSTVAAELLRRLADCGAVLRHHGDFDPSGLDITRAVLALGGPAARPWRMSTTDYRSAVAMAGEKHVALPQLTSRPGPTSWDTDLPEVMTSAAAVVEEEIVLDLLIEDLRAGSLR